MSGVLVLNADLSVLAFVDWQRAVTMLVSVDDTGVPLAQIYEADPKRSVHSPSVTVPFPRVIQLSRYLYVPYMDRRALLDDGGLATKRGVLDRDKRTCVYCGRAGATTVDHVLPQSRGGRNTWENLAACCKACNHRKADRTPEEAGMPLKWHPWRPDKTGYTQRQVWAGLEPAV